LKATFVVLTLVLAISDAHIHSQKKKKKKERKKGSLLIDCSTIDSSVQKELIKEPGSGGTCL
jgi:3-hydroxyisobutyrate dehydrogenase-like beta-hydroxyacid dehydrogenase